MRLSTFSSFFSSGYNKYDFWTSGNNLGTDMYLWMSTGLPFNATFNYMRRMAIDAPAQHADDSMDPLDMPQGSTAPQRTARHGYVNNCTFPLRLQGLLFVVIFFLTSSQLISSRI
jgi:hypothetical protein